MAAWILIITLVSAGSKAATIEEIGFNSEQACREAERAYSDATDLSGHYIRTVCVAK